MGCTLSGEKRAAIRRSKAIDRRLKLDRVCALTFLLLGMVELFWYFVQIAAFFASIGNLFNPTIIFF